MRYQYLVLPEHARYTPRALEKVLELVEAGATVIGPRPDRSPSLAGFPASDARIQELAAKIWPEQSGAGERRVGKGRVITGKSFETILAEDKLVHDFHSGEDDVWYIHRKLENGEVYFVSYQEDQTQDLNLTFRVTGYVPEIWDAVTGEKRVASAFVDNGTVTKLPIKMDPYGSRFVIFREPSAKVDPVVALTKDGKSAYLDNDAGVYSVWENGSYVAEHQSGKIVEATVTDLPAPAVVAEAWTVTFQEERGAPEGEVAFDQLVSWTENSEFGIKYFSGTASYKRAIEISEERLSNQRRVWLDLGDVHNLAEVTVNGQEVGVLWKSPYRIDITDAAQPGSNQVEVKVTNCWKNRILGDWKVPANEKITWTLYPFYHDEKDAELMTSGLLGPVRLVSTTSLEL